MDRLCVCCESYGTEPQPATRRLWCPTWVKANEGPEELCDNCSKHFTPEHDPRVVNLSLHWDKDADFAFKHVGGIFPRSDERYKNVQGMLNGRFAAPFQRCHPHYKGRLFICDGHIWYFSSFSAVRLGTLDDARQIFPAFFDNAEEKPKRIEFTNPDGNEFLWSVPSIARVIIQAAFDQIGEYLISKEFAAYETKTTVQLLDMPYTRGVKDTMLAALHSLTDRDDYEIDEAIGVDGFIGKCADAVQEGFGAIYQPDIEEMIRRFVKLGYKPR